MKKIYVSPQTEAVTLMTEQMIANSLLEVDDDPNKDVVKGDEWSKKKHPIWG